MSQTKIENGKIQKLTIRNRPGAEGKVSVGANVEVLLDGVPVRGASFVKVEIGARKVAKVLLEIWAEVDIETYSVIKESEKVRTPFVNVDTGQHYAKYELSSYRPEAIATKEET